ncbi:MAG: NUDIX domain-containing protein [Haloferacaceae archaeon]
MTDVVTAFLRNGGELLLVRRSDAVGTYAGLWGGVSGYVEPGTDDPLEDARRELREEVGVAEATLVRRGEPVDVVDGEREWTVHPFLFDVATRAVEPNEELAEWAWLPAPAMRERETVPALWAAYRRVAPSVETVAADKTHGSAWLSLRALEVLRDEAAVAGAEGEGDWDAVAEVARDLLAARPGMAAVANRVNRAMAVAGGDVENVDPGEGATPGGLESPPGTPAAVVESAQATLRAAVDADERAAATAADVIDGLRDGDDSPLVATLSRSGTVTEALLAARPRVLIGESRPAGEGADVAEQLATAGLAVTLTTDAALAWAFDAAAGTPTPDAVLVGADTVLPDGSVVNKVGTRALALAAARAGVPVYAVAARDKISPDATVHEASGPGGHLPAPAGVAVWNPLFDRTPADCVDVVVTEVGVLDAGEVGGVADRQRVPAEWE